MKLRGNILNCCNLYIFIWQQIGSCGSQQRPDSAQRVSAMSTLLLVRCRWFQHSLLTALLQQLLGGPAKCHYPFSSHWSFWTLRGVAGLSIPVEFPQNGRTYLSSVKSTLNHYEIRSLAGRTLCSYLIFVLHTNVIISLLLKSLTFIKYIAIFCQDSTKDCEDQEGAFQLSYMQEKRWFELFYVR